MQFTVSAAAFLAIVSRALAQTPGFDPITSPSSFEVINAGETFTIVWDAAPAEYDEETVTIVLLGGEARDKLQPIDGPIAEGVVNSAGSFAWDVPADLGDDAIYGFRIDLESDTSIFQYSNPFHIEAGDIRIPPGNSTSAPAATPTETESDEPTITPPSNSTSRVPPKTTVTRTEEEEVPAPTDDSVAPSPDSGAGSNAAAGLALIGGLAIAALAL
jgi:hypothetical protein